MSMIATWTASKCQILPFVYPCVYFLFLTSVFFSRAGERKTERSCDNITFCFKALSVRCHRKTKSFFVVVLPTHLNRSAAQSKPKLALLRFVSVFSSSASYEPISLFSHWSSQNGIQVNTHLCAFSSSFLSEILYVLRSTEEMRETPWNEGAT
jgi:glutamine synthetase adenylyltransferase